MRKTYQRNPGHGWRKPDASSPLAAPGRSSVDASCRFHMPRAYIPVGLFHLSQLQILENISVRSQHYIQYSRQISSVEYYHSIPENRRGAAQVTQIMTVSTAKHLSSHNIAALMYLIVYFFSIVLGSVVSFPGGHWLGSREDGLNKYDTVFGNDYSSADIFLASGAQKNVIDDPTFDGCLFSLGGCPSVIEDPNTVALDFGLLDGVENGGCDETSGGCTSLFDEWPSTSSAGSLVQPEEYHNYVASSDSGPQDGTQALNYPKPNIYYDCTPDHTSCIIHDRSRGPAFQLRASIHCPPDVSFAGYAIEGDNSNIKGPGLLGLPGGQCEFCLENGVSCELLYCDVASFASKNNDWGQEWGTCKDPSCSCSNSIKALNNGAVTEPAAASNGVGWLCDYFGSLPWC